MITVESSGWSQWAGPHLVSIQLHKKMTLCLKETPNK